MGFSINHQRVRLGGNCSCICLIISSNFYRSNSLLLDKECSLDSNFTSSSYFKPFIAIITNVKDRRFKENEKKLIQI